MFLKGAARPLPPHVKEALAAIARALGQKTLTPDVLDQVAEQFANSLDGHKLRIEHRPRPPKGTTPRPKALYILSIIGPRVDGKWSFSCGEFADLLRGDSDN